LDKKNPASRATLNSIFDKVWFSFFGPPVVYLNQPNKGLWLGSPVVRGRGF